MASDDQTTPVSRTCLACGGEFLDAAFCPHDGNPLTPFAEDPMIGSVLMDRYKITSLIGRGGMSVVYKAKHLLMHRAAAIKVLVAKDSHSIKRFRQEARLSANLSHSNIVTIYDFGFLPNQGQPFIAMDYLEGRTLAASIAADGPVPYLRALPIFEQACSALAYAHKQAVIHRDLKSSNFILVQSEGGGEILKLVDFGIAKRIEGEDAQELTRTGEVFGSPLYMSPEQCLGHDLDGRADIYSFGCVMYEVLTGRPPLAGRSSMETLHRHITEEAQRFSTVNPTLQIPPRLEQIVLKALEREPSHRYQTVNELWRDLRQFAASSQTTNTDSLEAESALSELDLPPVPVLTPSYDEELQSLDAAASTSKQFIVNIPGVNVSAEIPIKLEPSPEKVEEVGRVTADLPQLEEPTQKQREPSGTPVPQVNRTFRTIEHDKPIGGRSSLLSGSGHRPAEHQKMTWRKTRQHRSLLARNAIIGAVAVVVVAVICQVLGAFEPIRANLRKTAGVDTGGKIDFPSTKAANERWQELSSSGEKEFVRGNYALAASLFQQAYEVANQSGKKDLNLAKSLNDLGNIYYKQDRYQQAESTFKQALALRTELAGEGSLLAADTMNDLAILYGTQGDLAKAEKLLKQAFKIRKQESGEGSDETLETLRSLAIVYHKTGRFKEARKLLDEVLKYKIGKVDADSPGVVETFNSLAINYQLTRNLRTAAKYYDQALKTGEKYLVPGHPLVAESLVGLGTIEYNNNKLEDAEKHFQRALELREKSFGHRSLPVAEVVACLAILRDHEGKKAEALALMREALEIKEDILGPNSNETKRTRRLLEELQGEHDHLQ